MHAGLPVNGGPVCFVPVAVLVFLSYSRAASLGVVGVAGKLLLVMLGGAFGTACRYGLSSFVYGHLAKPTFPWANLIINVSGSFLIGLLAQVFEARALASPVVRAALLTGVLGGYTTFSSFAYETFELLRDGQWLLAVANAAGSVALGLLAVWAGVRMAQMVW